MNKFEGFFKSEEDIIREFQLTNELCGVELIYAQYDINGYDGSAHIIYRFNGELYEVNGSHCSCYGFEGQWKPELTTFDSLIFRPNVEKQAKDNLREAYKNIVNFI